MKKGEVTVHICALLVFLAILGGALYGKAHTDRFSLAEQFTEANRICQAHEGIMMFDDSGDDSGDGSANVICNDGEGFAFDDPEPDANRDPG